MSRVVMAAAVAVALAGPTTSRADMIFVGGYNFQSNAFADTLVSSYTSDPAAGGFILGPLGGGVTPPTLAQAVTGPYTGDYAFSVDFFSYVQLGFTDNVLRNGPGPDLALFEIGRVLDRFAVRLSPSLSEGDYREYQSAYTGYGFGDGGLLGNRLNVALIDLSDLGVPAGGELTSITVGLYPLTGDRNSVSSATLTVAAAFHPDAALSPSDPTPVPAPPGLLLALAAGVVGVAVKRRRG